MAGCKGIRWLWLCLGMIVHVLHTAFVCLVFSYLSTQSNSDEPSSFIYCCRATKFNSAVKMVFYLLTWLDNWILGINIISVPWWERDTIIVLQSVGTKARNNKKSPRNNAKHAKKLSEKNVQRWRWRMRVDINQFTQKCRAHLFLLNLKSSVFFFVFFVFFTDIIINDMN